MSSELQRILEVLLFTATQPLTADELCQKVKRGSQGTSHQLAFEQLDAVQILEALQQLQSEKAQTPVFLQEVAEGWRMATQPEYASWLLDEPAEPRPTRLSQPALETLAIIAYRQPISRSEIEAVRGVAAGGVLETLLEREVVRVAGRADLPGRPLLYETTPHFLEHFGLKDLSELPNVEELKRVELPKPKDDSQQPELIHESATAEKEN